MSEDISNPPKAEQECITSSPPPCYDWAEVEFIDAVEEGSMGGSSPIAEASVISSPLVGVGGEAEDVSMPAVSQEEPVAKDASSCPERKMDDLDALLAHLLQCGWESPWTVPAAVDRDLLERLVERNIQRLDLPPGVYDESIMLWG
ncbi:hypothetical protein Pmar_PMAR015355 [Perkinsus marinus ATCC 50983]|uniref:Uncharacterized protein n=1 Tax=Perkinsus marinus (strain ATCC 50983 / TXsc) TaxID=423536 RepID=C5LU59_PERM5|nr:hypothetical protein Pmar_PMAR015355 [Perkinsus marinus ATCC 50983]EEQ99733.1 hypothetical protein Pmar_PMAR015355 [Perkinsus marinus ATCC 50983]|eukprot:XP_002767016.1 hypothetical protein Pmar_PMAR015355 [Perkinsus marinus ATCC 50983]